MCISTVLVGSALWSMLGPGTPGLGLAFLTVVAWSALAAVPLTGLISYLLGNRAASAAKQFAFSWRAFAAMLFFLVAIELNILTDQQADWPRIHRVVALATLLLGGAGVTFGLLAVSRRRRLGTRLLDSSQCR
jgi:hypothetical protein